MNSIAHWRINLNLIDGGGLCFFFDHAQIYGDGVPDILSGFFKGVALAVAAGKHRAVSIVAVFGLVYNNRIIHNYLLTYAGCECKEFEKLRTEESRVLIRTLNPEHRTPNLTMLNL